MAFSSSWAISRPSAYTLPFPLIGEIIGNPISESGFSNGYSNIDPYQATGAIGFVQGAFGNLGDLSAGDGPGKGKKTQTEGGLSVANGSGIGIRKNGDGQLESYNTNYRSPDSRFVDPFAAIIFYLYGVDLTGEFSSNRIMLSDGSSVLASGPTFLPGSGGAAKTGVQLAL